MSKLPKDYREFKEKYPEIVTAYENLGKAAAESGPLDEKTRELIKLGMAAARSAKSAVKSHAHRALQAGATVEEIEHAVLLGVNTLGFAAMMTALGWVRDALEDD